MSAAPPWTQVGAPAPGMHAPPPPTMQPLNPGAGQAAQPDYSMVSGLEDIGYNGWHVKNITLPTCLGGDGTAVPVFAHSLLLIWPIIACVGAATSGAGFGEFTYYLLVTGPCTWAIVLLHEIGHLIAAQRCGGQPKKSSSGRLAVSLSALTCQPIRKIASTFPVWGILPIFLSGLSSISSAISLTLLHRTPQ
ncbi:hypothetical protein TrLO_g3561 [Triparma laevis f. longispina]|uniref:Uncharacterized protein n=1 Tax=Triparma laevis f. longispina TaxID=1714387 RepID=A0A9W7DQ34_9STRA|nr:hypothetical protein TrLO_g3561 [Triparma laevis f. longispina]